jgi:hypothetical protein
MSRESFQGMWSSTLQKDHINLLEMRAVLLALSHYKLCLESLSIVLATDNTTVVTGNWRCQGKPCHDIFPLQPPRQMSRESFQDRNRGFLILRRRGSMLEKIKL